MSISLSLSLWSLLIEKWLNISKCNISPNQKIQTEKFIRFCFAVSDKHTNTHRLVVVIIVGFVCDHLPKLFCWLFCCLVIQDRLFFIPCLIWFSPTLSCHSIVCGYRIISNKKEQHFVTNRASMIINEYAKHMYVSWMFSFFFIGKYKCLYHTNCVNNNNKKNW